MKTSTLITDPTNQEFDALVKKHLRRNRRCIVSLYSESEKDRRECTWTLQGMTPVQYRFIKEELASKGIEIRFTKPLKCAWCFSLILSDGKTKDHFGIPMVINLIGFTTAPDRATGLVHAASEAAQKFPHMECIGIKLHEVSVEAAYERIYS